MAHLADTIDIFLAPGEFFVGDRACQIRTILGSCVSITLWHPERKVGGMSHFLLPTRGHAMARHHYDGRYGDEALALVVDQLQAQGINVRQCEGKIFGGGNMFPEHFRHAPRAVGKRNGHAARTLLQDMGIPIVSESLFGEGHRQIIFDVSTGDVWSRQIKPTAGMDGSGENHGEN